MSSRIMIVEDEGIIATDLAESLTEQGYEVVGTCRTGEDAVDQVMRLAPDLILMDIHLGGPMDGTEAARIIRDKADAAIVYLTAYADPETFESAQDAAPYGYLVKPYEDQNLRTTVETALRRRNEARRSRRMSTIQTTALDHLHEGIVIVLEDGTVEQSNQVARDLLGQDLEALGALLSSANKTVGPSIGPWQTLASGSPHPSRAPGGPCMVSATRIDEAWVLILTPGTDAREHGRRVQTVKASIRVRASQLI